MLMRRNMHLAHLEYLLFFRQDKSESLVMRF